MRTSDIEIAVAGYFFNRSSLIVPNISWGLGIHECDLLIIRKSGFCIEVEIKVSGPDLIKDALKGHRHDSDKIKYLYFAIPERLLKYQLYIPARAGIILVKDNGEQKYCHVEREAETNKSARKLTDKEMYDVARLGALRIWGLKKKIVNLKKSVK